MRIIYFITALGVGGAERQVCDLADQLTLLGHEVIIVSLTGQAKCLPSNSSVQVIQLQTRISFMHLIKGIINVRRLIRLFKPDVIHSHMYHAIVFTRLLRLIIPMPIHISTSHCSDEFSKLRMITYRITDMLTTLSTNVSESAQFTFIQKGAWTAARSSVIYNGVDTNCFQFNLLERSCKRKELDISDETILLLAVGRLVPEKDYWNMLRAFSLVVSDNNDVKLLIIGKGDALDSLLALRSQLGIDGRVIFLGESRDIEKWMSAADLFVFSSVKESFGLVLAEAMSCGLPVVSTSCGHALDIISQFGITVPVNNHIALAKAMQSSILTINKDKNFRQNPAREHIVINYSIKNIANQWINLYKSVAS